MIRIAIIGTGGMAHAHADNFRKIRGVKLVAACDVDRQRAAAFTAKWAIPHVYTDVEKLLADCAVDAIANVTPDSFHAPISLAAIAQGKHVLCEKPLATCYADAKKMADATRRAGVINMVQFSYRNSSALQQAHILVQAGEIGRVIHFEASYLQSWLVSKCWGDWHTTPAFQWRLSTKHGSKGALGDIGVHIVDFASFVTGDVKAVNCKLKVYPEIKGKKLGPYTLDANDSAVAWMELANGAVGTVHTTRWSVGQINSLRLRVYGEKGGITVDLDQAYDKLQICRGKDIDGGKWRTLSCGKTPTIFQRFITSIRTGQNDQPDFARGAAVQKVLDACFASADSGATVKV